MKAYTAFGIQLPGEPERHEVGKTYDDDRGFCIYENLEIMLWRHPVGTAKYYMVDAQDEMTKSGDLGMRFRTISIVQEISMHVIGETLAADNDYANTCKNAPMELSIAVLDDKPAMTRELQGTSIALGDCGAAIAAGAYASTLSVGKSSISVTTGHSSKSATAGEKGIAAALGGGIAKGTKGSWLVLTSYIGTTPDRVLAVQVDGEKIKADTWYRLADSGPVIAHDYYAAWQCGY